MKKKRFLLIILSILVVTIAGFFTVQMVQADPLNEKLKEAKEAYDNEEFDKSATLYGEALELESGHVEARIGHANSYIALSQAEDAIDTLKEGIRLNAKEPRFYYFLSSAYIAAQDANNALLALQDGVEATGNDALEELYEQSVSNTYIDVERPFVQIDHSRELSLVWENNGIKLPIEAEWEVDSDLGEITNTDESTIEFTGTDIGEVKVTATVESIEKEIELQVEEQVIEEIHFEPTELDPLNIGETAYVSVTGLDANGEEMNFTPEWESSKDIIEFNTTEGQSISFTTVDEGLTMISAEYQELVEEYKVIVAGENKILSTTVDGEGNIFVNPDEASYPVDSEVTLEAVPLSGWEFVRWEGDVSGNQPRITVTMDGHKDIRAVFSPLDDETPILDVIPELDVIEEGIPVVPRENKIETKPETNYKQPSDNTNTKSENEKEKSKSKQNQSSSEKKSEVKDKPDKVEKPKVEKPKAEKPKKEEKKEEKPKPKVETIEQSVVRNIPYETVTRDDSSLEKGKEIVESPGSNGQRRITYVITLTDGKETNRSIKGSEVIKEPTNRVIIKGTKEPASEDDSEEQNLSE